MVIRSDDIVAVVPLVVIGLIHRQISRRGVLLLVLLNLPITIMHELAHYAAALFLGGNPSGFTLWPRRVEGRWHLGSVTARATILSAVPTALAPLAWLFAAVLLLAERHAVAGDSLQALCYVYFAAYLCVAASFPSRQDITVAVSHPLSFMLWTAVMAGAYVLITQTL